MEAHRHLRQYLGALLVLAWSRWRFDRIWRDSSGGEGIQIPSPHFCATIRATYKRLKMLSTALWIMALALESALLLRAFQANFLKHYRLFYLYLGWVLISDVSRILFYYLLPKTYGYAYWYSQFISVVVGCAVVWEAYKVALGRYPGTARIARDVLPFMFILALTRVLVKAWNSPNWIPGKTTLETERDLRTVQLALLLGLVALFASYAIPLGRNLKGIIYGYGLFIATSVVHLTLRDYLGDSFQRSWQYIQPACYVLVLLAWCVSLWSYAPIPEPTTDPGLEADYESLVATTKRKLQSVRGYLLKAMGL